jgi:hypothetical protein
MKITLGDVRGVLPCLDAADGLAGPRLVRARDIKRRLLCGSVPPSGVRPPRVFTSRVGTDPSPAIRVTVITTRSD